MPQPRVSRAPRLSYGTGSGSAAPRRSRTPPPNSFASGRRSEASVPNTSIPLRYWPRASKRDRERGERALPHPQESGGVRGHLASIFSPARGLAPSVRVGVGVVA